MVVFSDHTDISFVSNISQKVWIFGRKVDTCNLITFNLDSIKLNAFCPFLNFNIFPTLGPLEIGVSFGMIRESVTFLLKYIITILLAYICQSHEKA